MINITFPDGSVRQYESGVSAFDIAQSISPKLAAEVLAATVVTASDTTGKGTIYDVTRPIVEEAIRRTREARLYIMDEVMSKAIAEPRKELSKYAPKIESFKIDPDKIREVIGTGGKVINEIIAQCDQCKIDIEDDGRVTIYHMNRETINKAKAIIEKMHKPVLEWPIKVVIFNASVISVYLIFSSFFNFKFMRYNSQFINRITEKKRKQNLHFRSTAIGSTAI